MMFSVTILVGLSDTAFVIVQVLFLCPVCVHHALSQFPWLLNLPSKVLSVAVLLSTCAFDSKIA